MTVLNEGRHAAEFLKSEANGTRSRDTATVASGQTLVAGEVVMLSGGELVAHDGALDTQGDVITPAVGIMWDAVDASAAAVDGAVYVARDAEVNGEELTYPTESTAGGEKAAVQASLKTLGIVCL